MNNITNFLNTRLAPELLPLMARFCFAATVLLYFWRSAKTKIGDNLWTPSDNAYIQVFPKAVEAAGYDTSVMGLFEQLVVLAGTYGEFVLPALIVLGLFTRLAALGMLVFLAVMTYVDVTGHGVALGTWFDGSPKDLIADIRVYWVLALTVLLCMGPGSLSVDKLLFRGRG